MKELDLISITSEQSFINYCFKSNSEDVAYWENWLKENPEYSQQIEELKTSILVLPIPAAEKVIEHDYQKLQNSISGLGKKTSTLRLWTIVSGVAAAVALMVVGSYIYRTQLPEGRKKHFAVASDIAPGKIGATLTLANGKRILLSDAKTGELAKESGVVITKTATGELIYEIKDQSESSQSTNILSTAKGETYQVVLPDGSKVWLNAASSLKYPAKFTALKERRVSLDGEAYFEVAKDKAHPFIVSTTKQDVEVLGTHFNVNSYADEAAIRTTLLEGSVRVSGLNGSGSAAVLRPGEQSSLGASGKLSVGEADGDQVIAWKNGKFVFDDENIESIMRKLSRWYNIEVVYQGDVSGRTFDGSISRYDNISKILDKITFTQAAHFKIEGRRVTVMK